MCACVHVKETGGAQLLYCTAYPLLPMTGMVGISTTANRSASYVALRTSLHIPVLGLALTENTAAANIPGKRPSHNEKIKNRSFPPMT